MNELEISVHSSPLRDGVRDFQLGVVMGTRSLPSILQMVRNLAAAFLGLRGTPPSLTSVMVIRPAGIFDIPLPSRLRTTFLGDPDAFGDVDDGGKDGADAISLTCWDTLSKDRRGELWKEISNSFNITEANKARMERQALLAMGHTWRTFKSTLVTKYVNTGRTPFTKYKFLSRDIWDAFVQMKTTAEFQE